MVGPGRKGISLDSGSTTADEGEQGEEDHKTTARPKPSHHRAASLTLRDFEAAERGQGVEDQVFDGGAFSALIVDHGSLSVGECHAIQADT
jgi:hypothetical protein